MRLSFIFPQALWLLLLLPLLLAPALLTRRVAAGRLGAWRFWGLLLLRVVSFGALVLAVAGTQLVRPIDRVTTVFLLDGSDSVAPARRAEALTYINAALATARPGDRGAVVLFGQNALVERAPSDPLVIPRVNSAVIASRTSIADALQLGMALFPADAQKRLVLLSDGRENLGRAAEIARLAAVRGIPIDSLPLADLQGADVQVVTLDGPDTARENQAVPLTARINSSLATTGRLQVFANNELIQTLDVTLQPGMNDVAIHVPAGATGFARYEVRLEAAGDTQPLNNRAATFTSVQGPPLVLLVAADSARATPLAQALSAAGARVEVQPPAQLSADQATLRRYVAIVLVDVPARSVPSVVQRALPVYVREQGGTLVMVGGTDSFGAGGWRRSPVAAVLPVELEPPTQRERPDVALALVIDRSGSMTEVGNSGRSKLDLAKEAVYQASLGLEQGDQVGVVVFDEASDWVLPLQSLPSVLDIEQALSKVSDGGGTNIRSGIEPAAQALASVDARTKHMILLTDGIADSNYADLIDQMRNQQVTISIVSIGQDANPALEQIAQQGGGRYYRVVSASDVPRIFLAETVLIAKRDIVEETFVPTMVLPVPVVRGLGLLPSLYGYNATGQRQAARTILVSPDGKPILAQWQYGLGRSLAWTSDMKAQWGRDWITWAQFPTFAAGLLDAMLPPQRIEGLAMETRIAGAQAILEVTVEDGQRQPIEAAQLVGQLLDPADQGAPLNFTQIGPGRYRAVAPAEAAGVYLAQVAVLDGTGQSLGSVNGGLVVAYSPEYALGTPNSGRGLLDTLTRATNGRIAPAPNQIFIPTQAAVGSVSEIALPLLWLALILWPLDIALRRLLVRRSDLAALRSRLRIPWLRSQPQTASADTTFTRLQAARTRARRSPPQDAPTATARDETPPPVPPPPPPLAPPPPPSEGKDAGSLAGSLLAKKRDRKG